jgi:hypothetical protein
MVNLPMTSVMELRGHRMAIAAVLPFSEKLAPQCFGTFSTASTRTGHLFGQTPVQGARSTFRSYTDFPEVSFAASTN